MSAPEVRRAQPSAFDWEVPAGGAEVVRRVVDACLQAGEPAPVDEAATLALRHRGLDGAALWLAGDAGFASLHGLPDAPGPVEVDLVVAPEHRGSGVGRALAEAVLSETGGTPLLAWSHGQHPAADRLAAACGARAVRELWVMRRPLDVPLPDAPAPDDVVVRPFRPGHDEEAFLAVNAAAFADHPEQGALDLAGLRERMAEDWFDPAGFLLAEDAVTGDLLGYHWTKVHAEAPGGGRSHGEVYVIGMAPAAQGRGLGRVLLFLGLDHLRNLGLDEVVLYVEADNHPAVALYERSGFRHDPADTHVQYRRG